MSNLFSKAGKTGAKVGGRVAAKKIVKSVSKRFGKQFAKKTIKKFTKGAVKKSAKKMAKKGGKKVGKKVMKKATKKVMKKMKKSGKKGNKKSAKQSKKAGKSKPKQKGGKKKKKEKKEKEKKEKGDDDEDEDDDKSGAKKKSERIKSVKADKKKKEKKSKSKDSKAKTKAGKKSITPSVSATSSDVATTHQLETKKGAIQFEQGLKPKPSGSFLSSQSEESTASSAADSSSNVMESTETPPESREISRTQGLPDSHRVPATPPAKASYLARRPSQTMAAHRSRIWPRDSDETPARKSLIRKKSSGADESQSGPVGPRKSVKHLASINEDIQSALKDQLAGEAANEMNDTAFNLMLFRMAKNLMMEGQGTKDGAGRSTKRKKKVRTSDWLRALSMILTVQNESGHSRKARCLAGCENESCQCCCKRITSEGKKTKLPKSAEAKPAEVGDDEFAEGDRASRLTKTENKLLNFESDSSESTTDLSSSSISSYEPRRFRESTDRFCDVLRALYNDPTPTNACQPQPTYGTSTPVDAPQPYQQVTCCCCNHDLQKPTTPYSVGNTSFMAPECRPNPMPMGYGINPVDSLLPTMQIHPSAEPVVLTGGVVDPNVIYMPEFYF